MYLAWVWEYYLQNGDLAFLNTNYTQLTNIAQYVNRSLDPTTGLISQLYGGMFGSYTNGIIDWPPNMQFGYDLNTVRGAAGCSSTVIDGWAWEDYDIMSRIANEVGNTAECAYLPRDGRRHAGRDERQPDQRQRSLRGHRP